MTGVALVQRGSMGILNYLYSWLPSRLAQLNSKGHVYMIFIIGKTNNIKFLCRVKTCHDTHKGTFYFMCFPLASAALCSLKYKLVYK